MMGKNLASALEDLHRARLRARERFSREPFSRQLEDIPLDAIVGSVGRYKDFSRSFLPKQGGVGQRWARVEVAMTAMEGVPPIDVYKVGDVYFVRDGNHRVSVARQMGSDHIQAYVIEVATRVPLSPDAEPDDLIIKAEYTEFLEHTSLDETRPEAEMGATVPGQYQVLEEHIEVHRHFMGLEQERHISYEEAAAHWYDEVYSTVVRLAQKRGVLRDFPERTETDLHLWLAEHRAELEDQLGWHVTPEMAASDLVERFSQQPGRVIQRIGRRVLTAIAPAELEVGPPTGQWREEQLVPRQDGRLFASILVSIPGDERGWSALGQELTIAHREQARLHGLHVLPSEDEKEHPEAQARPSPRLKAAAPKRTSQGAWSSWSALSTAG